MKLTPAYLAVLTLLTPGLTYKISSDAKDGHVLALRTPPIPEGRPGPEAGHQVDIIGEMPDSQDGSIEKKKTYNEEVFKDINFDNILGPKAKRESFKDAYSELPVPEWSTTSEMSSEDAITILSEPRNSLDEQEGSFIGSSAHPKATRWTRPQQPAGLPTSDFIEIFFENAPGKEGIPGKIRYYVSPEEKVTAVDSAGHPWPIGYAKRVYILYTGEVVAKVRAMGANIEKESETRYVKRTEARKTLTGRSNLQALDASSSVAPAQTPRETFSMYLELLTAAQAIVGAAINPGLHNVTSQTNNSLVHQMAASIYYDLTGSTTVLLGPFNYGLNFLGNMSTSQAAGKTSTSNMTRSMTTLESIYTHMWLDAVAAANSTGIFQEMIHIAGCLNTNDTSVMPSGFMTGNKTATIWQ